MNQFKYITQNLPVSERFAASHDKAGPNECWRWTKFVNNTGYGVLVIKKKQVLAHRLSYQLHVGEIPHGMFVCHSCDNRICVNPAHLWLGTAGDNNRDRDAKGRSRGGAMKGEQNPLSKLTSEQVLAIAFSTTPLKSTAEKFGIPFQCVSAIRRGSIWSSVTGIVHQPFKIDGVTPKQRKVIDYIAQKRTVRGCGAISKELGNVDRTYVSKVMRKLQSQGRLRRVGHGIWQYVVAE